MALTGMHAYQMCSFPFMHMQPHRQCKLPTQTHTWQCMLFYLHTPLVGDVGTPALCALTTQWSIRWQESPTTKPHVHEEMSLLLTPHVVTPVDRCRLVTVPGGEVALPGLGIGNSSRVTCSGIKSGFDYCCFQSRLSPHNCKFSCCFYTSY